jgi:hypothetical protein
MRYWLIALPLLFGPIPPANADIGLSIGTRGLSIGINVPAYPNLVQIPGYPVYYAPGLDTNYFFYDGLYWVFAGDRWYESSWYDGPWEAVDADDVPLFLLRVPVRYYRRPPTFFHGWRADRAPHWGEHWGHEWERRRGEWRHWDRRSVPPPAPLPSYQQRYSGRNYPHAQQEQHSIRSEQYRYRPHEPLSQRRFEGNPGRPGAEAHDQRRHAQDRRDRHEDEDRDHDRR